MLDLKINHLQLLAQIVSTGSLTEAAQNLGLSAAAASRMLKKLQTEMNDPLFIRVWRGLTPTDTTTMMLPVVRELLEQMERLEYQKSFTPAKLSATITTALPTIPSSAFFRQSCVPFANKRRK